MVPTPRTEAIIGPLRTSLSQIEQSLFGPQDFNEATTETRFFVGASDYAAALLVPKIMRRLAERMPTANLAIRRADKSDMMALLANGEIDIALGMSPDTSPWVRRRRLFKERHVCVFNPGLLNLPDPLSLQDFLGCDHMLVSLDGTPSGFVDRILEKLGHQRRVSVSTPYFLQSAYLLERLPLIATLPERFALECSSLSKMAIRKLPFDGPEFDVSAAWRAGDERNPRIASLQDVVLTASH